MTEVDPSSDARLQSEADKHSADASLVGVGYQFQVALLRLLGAGDGAKLYLETLDDIEFQEGELLEAIQVKHHLKKAANITDKGTEIWKTLQGWVDQFRAGRVPAGNVSFILISTGQAKSGTLAELMENRERTNDQLSEKIAAIGSTSSNMDITSCAEAIDALGPEDKERLLHGIQLISNSTQFSALDDEILHELRRSHGDSAKRQALRDMVVGWWFRECFNHLAIKVTERKSLTGSDLQDQIDYFREQLRPTSLPIDLPVILSADGSVNEAALFIRQLLLLGLVDERSLKSRTRNFMRAMTARSEWFRLGLISEDELDQFDEVLQETWSLKFGVEVAKITSGSPDDRKKAGIAILEYAELHDTHKLRSDCDAQFIRRGSYHLLADKKELALGWHPDFKDILQEDPDVL
jgi:hypothetical protein